MPLDNILAARAGLQSTNDFNTYRKHATRKVAKLRREHGIAHKAAGKPPAQPSAAEQWSLALWLSERSWAAAMEARSALEATESPLLRRQQLAKLAKAYKYAQKAVSLASTADFLSETDQLALLVGAALTETDLAVQQRNWLRVLKAGSQARVGCQVLAGLVGSVEFTDVLSTTVDPALRIAAHQTKTVKADVPRLARQQAAAANTPLTKLVGKLDPSALATDAVLPTEKLGPVQWRDYTAHVEDPDLAQALLTAREKNQAFTGTDFDALLLAWQEAADSVHSLIAASSSSKDANKQDLHVIATYVSFNILMRRIQRDAALLPAPGPVSSLTVLRDVVRVCDNILQSVEQASELPGVFNDDDLAAALTTLTSCFSSRRAAAIAQGYALSDQHAAALSLILRADAHLAEAKPIADDAGIPLSNEDVAKWRQELTRLRTRQHGLAALDAAAKLNTGFLSDNTALYPAGKPADVLSRLVDLDARVRPVTVKPVLYDTAFNYIDYASSSAAPAHTASAAALEEGDKKKGLFGLFR